MGIEVIGSGGPPVKTQRVEYIKSTQTWTAPDDVDTVEVILIGGGGAGWGWSNQDNMSRGGGGGAGGYVHTDLQVTPGGTYSIGIGSGGSDRNSNAGNASDWYSNKGNDSNFGNLLKAYGGGGAVANSALSNASVQGPFGSQGAIMGNSVANNGTQIYARGAAGAGAGGPSTGSGSKTSDFGIVSNANTDSYTYALTHGAVQGHGVISSNTTYESPGFIAGKGIGGRAGGGGPGVENENAYTFLLSAARSVGSGGGLGATKNQNATSGQANTGGGGGGGIRYNSTKRDAGHGGSGICIIKYWSAL